MHVIFDFVSEHLWPIEMFVFWYPVVMGLLWTVGGIIYHHRLERKDPVPPKETPFVSVLVPAFNEADNIAYIVEKLCETNYPNYEIIVINDGSKDDSSRIETELAQSNPKVRLVDLHENNGKANALYLGLLAAKGEYLMCVDGDSYLDPDCIGYMVAHFVNKGGERVGAVTGNPRVRNRSSLLARIQVCEYASIISLIKRTQRIWGKVMTVSGVCVMYSKKALLDVGLWDRDMVAEDIAVTWKLEKSFWDVRYEPNALCYMLVPETVKGLIKQRKRWAQGGQEVMFRHANIFTSWKRRRMVPVYLEQITSLLWIVSWVALFLTEIFRFSFNWTSYLPYFWRTQFLSIICLIQISVAVGLEHKYDKHIFKNMLVAAWYPIIYWIISGLVSLMALPGTIRHCIRGGKATWVSPDRGIKADSKKSRKADTPVAATVSGTAAGQAVAGPDTQKAKDGKSDESYEVRGRQKPWKRVIEAIVTVGAWCYVLSYLGYVIYGIVCVHMGITPISIFLYNAGVITETHRLCFLCLIILLVEILILIFWKEYNRIRFGKLNRRTVMPDATVEDMAVFYDIPEATITAMQENTVTVLEKNIIPEDFNCNRQKKVCQKVRKERKKKMELAGKSSNHVMSMQLN